MSEEIVMPQIGQDVTTGKIVEWLKKENDPVEKGEIVCNVEGDKGIFEVEADESGVLLKILHQAGDSGVAILKNLAVAMINKHDRQGDPNQKGNQINVLN